MAFIITTFPENLYQNNISLNLSNVEILFVHLYFLFYFLIAVGVRWGLTQQIFYGTYIKT